MSTDILPIESIKQNFVSLLDKSNIVVQSSTGSGKSTQLPLWCMSRGRVLVVEPRRLACRSLARYVSSLYSANINDHKLAGEKVGYAIRFDNNYNAHTELIFVTPGIALRWFSENQLSNFKTIILDEFHERRWDCDLLAAMLLKHQLPEQRLVITSATVEGDRLSRYIHGKTLQAGGRMFPVEVRYAETNELPQLKDLEQRVFTALKQAITDTASGDVLIFLPGKSEIYKAIDLLKSKLSIELIPLHAGIDNATQDKALLISKQRRVILATNVAETSLTIPGVSVVIDSGLERRTHHRNARTVLSLHCISQASAEQRKGRAGRVKAGLCIRLWGKQARLEDYTPAEIEREELTELLLAAAAGGVPATRLNFPNKLPQHAVNRATELLLKMGAIDKDNKLTKHGKLLYPLPLDPLFSHLISAMSTPEYCAAMIDLSAALSVNQNLLPILKTEQDHKNLQKWQPKACDATTLIKLIRETPPNNIHINASALKEARKIAKHVRQALNLPSLHSDNAPVANLLKEILLAQPDLAYVRRKKRKDALGNGYAEVEISRETCFSPDDEAAVVLDQHSMPAKGMTKTINLATCMAPIPLKLLHQLNFGDVEYTTPQWSNDKLSVLQRRIFAGRVIHESIVIPIGVNARQAICTLILENRLFKKVGQQIRTDIEAWNLYLSLGMGEGNAYDVTHWLETKLKALGVEASDDLQLIEASDLNFDGIPAWEREEFDSRFPRNYQLANLKMQVSYEAKKRRITLTKLNGSRKNAPQIKEIPTWSGWSVRFVDGSRVIAIK